MNKILELAETHMKEKKLSCQELASRIGVSRSMLSQYRSGTYGNPANLEKKLMAYLEEQGASFDTAESKPTLDHSNRFYQSSDARRILAVCNMCQEFSVLGFIAGKSGFGKTHALKEYAKLPNVAYIECDDTMGRRDLVEALESALGLSQGYGSLYRRTEVIVSQLSKREGFLIIIDEADKLISKSTQKKMEILRKLVDKVKVGMVLAGEPQLIPLVKNYDARFANRGSYVYSLNGLDKKEAAEYLARLPIEPQALEELTGRACSSRNGCFRLLDRTLNNVIRLLRDRSGTRITLGMIEEASDMMML